MTNAIKEENTTQGGKSAWAQILGSIENPLVFFALALLTVEAALTAVLTTAKLGSEATFLTVVIMAGLFLVIVLCVALLTYVAPKNLMAQVKETAREEAEVVSKAASEALRFSQLRRTLTRLDHELRAFQWDAPVNSMQKNAFHEGLKQDPYSVYVEPTVQEILSDPQVQEFLNEDVRVTLEGLLSPNQYSIGESIKRLEDITRRVERRLA